MNLGHGLQQAGNAERVNAAIEAYANAIALFRAVPAPEQPAWTNSLAAALMNRGQLLHRAKGTAAAGEVRQHFDEAEKLLESIGAARFDAANPWPRRNLAGTHLNRATLLLDLGRAAEARPDAQRALELSSAQERTEIVDADLALKARRALCDALGRLIALPGADTDAIASEASDLVDDALALARDWEARCIAELHPLALRFFRYGAQLYRLHQPHFLAEFLVEHFEARRAAPDPEYVAIALQSLDAAIADCKSTGFFVVGDPESERRARIERELVAARERIARLTG